MDWRMSSRSMGMAPTCLLYTSFKEFLLSRKYSGLLAKTIDSYKNLIHRFVDFIGADTDMSCITDDDLKRYLASLYDLNLSRSSIASYIRNPRIFLKWYAFEYGKDIQYLSLIHI